MNEDICVVMTLYKRPKTLRQQLLAIQNQTIKPKRIVLFQDRIPEDYYLCLTDEMRREFDDVYEAEENEGVWGRFRYAKTQTEKYICVFDDDTIPGKMWLENCLNEMGHRKAVYGTIGVCVGDYENYLTNNEDNFRIGWDMPNEKAARVDFVGHSWFFERDWLEYMFEGTEKYQQIKYAAEDMSLSFQCAKHGIPTFVPPHPTDNYEMWGSMPKEAVSYGADGAALSLNGNSNNIQKAIAEYIKTGEYTPLVCVDRKEFDFWKRVSKRYMVKRRWLYLYRRVFRKGVIAIF